jgi:hypothetical protein
MAMDYVQGVVAAAADTAVAKEFALSARVKDTALSVTAK